MRLPRISRRKFLLAGLAGLPLVSAADALAVEPRWLRLRTLKLGPAPPIARFVHFTDLHHKGNAAFLRSVVQRINTLKPDFVCFTGDIIENGAFLEEALAILADLNAPAFGVPGNHDHWSGVDFAPIARGFARTGGAWLVDRQVSIAGGRVNLIGLDKATARFDLVAGARNIVLMHYPVWADELAPHRFDLLLAGHTHGGQVRFPFIGALMVPFNTGRYELGLYQTPAGPLYVGAGIGHWLLPVRFGCRPEITLIEI